MSTDSGDAKLVADIIADAKAMLAAESGESEQLDLLSPLTPEEILEAKERLGPDAGRLSLVRDAREARKRGRPAGSRNKRTDDFARLLLSRGQHPAFTLMEIQATDPELLIEASKQEKVHSFSQKTGKPNVVIERLSYAEAQGLRIRCAEALLPYLESKKPIAVDATIRGVRVIEQRGEMKPVGATVDGKAVRVAKDIDLGDEA